MTWQLVVAKPAQKALGKLPAKDRKRIESALAGMRENPFGGDVVRLKAHPVAWRRRVGDYRIFYDLYPDRLRVVVTAVLRRTSTTY